MNLMNRFKPNPLWKVGVGAASLGLLASFLQSIQTINHFKDPTEPLVCDINAIFSCNSVFDAWQSSIFGFSNSLMCMVFFAISLGVLLAGATGSKVNKKLSLWVHFFTVFFLFFGAWYLWSSAFVIGALCIYCLFCYTAVIILNAAWLRLNVNDLPVKKSVRSRIKHHISQRNDLLAWILWGTAFAVMFVIAF